MRPLYFILKLTLVYSLNLYFRRILVINKIKKFKDSVITVYNHPSAFLDPLIGADLNNLIIYFMVRSDVFKWWLRPITWLVHMMPIYRSIDGAGSLDKNKDVFNNAFKVLKRRKGLIIFGEGYTDDVFIRSLKPMKKGPARIAFGAMEDTNWQLDLKICCVGLNYSNPNVMRSELVFKNSDYIYVKDYKELYEENPSKAALKLTNDIKEKLQANITYVENKSLAPLHENIMRLTRKGINPYDYDASIPLKQRFEYSQQLAVKMNEMGDKESEMQNLLKKTEEYFAGLSRLNILEKHLYQYTAGKRTSAFKQILFLSLGFILFLLGCLHAFIPYILTKKFVERTFRRRVFWGGVKMMLGKLFIGLYNIPLVILLNHYLIHNGWLSLLYFFTVPALSGLFAYEYKLKVNETKYKFRFNKLFNTSGREKLDKLASQREELLKEIQTLFN